MADWARIKSITGAKGKTATIASATAMVLPEQDLVFFVTGTTTVTTITTPAYTRRKMCWLIGAASANFTLTNNDLPNTAGQMYLQGSNLTVQEDDVVCLFCKADGTWILVSTTTG